MSYIFEILALGTPMLVCLFWSLEFLLQIRHTHVSKRIMCGFMVTATLLYFAHFCVFNDLITLIPLTDTIYTFATLSVYPIFYLYLIALTGKLNWKHALAIVPGIVIAIIVGISYLTLPENGTEAFIKACIYEDGPLPAGSAANLGFIAHQVMKYIILLEVLLVLPFGFRRLKNFKQKVNNCFSNTEHRDLREIRLLLLFFVITSVLSVCSDIIGRAYFVDSFILTLIPILGFSTMLFFLGHEANRQKFTIDDLTAETAVTSRDQEPESDILDTQEKDSLSDMLLPRIVQLMNEEKMFLQPDLKISDLAEKLNTNRTYIYKAIKESDSESPVSFSDYVNRYRIEYSIEQLKNKPDESIEDIMIQSGFVSKSTFYNNFKKYTGMTPREYVKKIRV